MGLWSFFFLTSHSARLSAGGVRFGDSVTRIQIVVLNALNWPKYNSQHVSSFMGSDFCVFKDKFFLHIFLFCVLMNV